jgi:hypothetical protein
MKNSPKKSHDTLILTFEKNVIEFHREFYFRERFEKRVFPTDPLSRTDTFGTHCILNLHSICVYFFLET